MLAFCARTERRGALGPASSIADIVVDLGVTVVPANGIAIAINSGLAIAIIPNTSTGPAAAPPLRRIRWLAALAPLLGRARFVVGSAVFLVFRLSATRAERVVLDHGQGHPCQPLNSP